MKRYPYPLPPPLCAVWTLATLVVGASPVRADAAALRMNAALGAGSLFSQDQLGYLGYDGLGVAGSLGVGYEVASPLVIEARASGAGFSSESQGGGGLVEAGLGARLETTELLARSRIGPFAHISVAKTGPDIRPSMDVGVRAAYQASDSWSLGPEVAYGRVFQADRAGSSTDAQFVLISLALGWQPTATPPPIVRQPPAQVADPFELEPLPPAPDITPELDRLLDEALPVSRSETTLIPPVLFQFDSSEMVSCGEAALYDARDAIQETEGTVVIEGHADGTGATEYNRDLSSVRAQRVRTWLVEHGIGQERLEVEAHGERRPLAEETGERPRQINRRVTFRTERRESR